MKDSILSSIFYRPGSFLRFWVLGLTLALGPAAGSLAALEEVQIPFSWKPVEGAGAYRVDVVDEKGTSVFSKTVKEDEELKVVLSLFPSRYALKLTTINRFMVPEASTPWKTFIVPASTPPLLENLDPPRETWGQLVPFHLSGSQMSGGLGADLVGPDGKHYPLDGAWTTDRDHWQFTPPADLDPGHYDLILTNPPGQVLRVKEAFTVLVTQPLVKAVAPAQFRIDHAPKTLTLSGSRFFEGVQVYLVPGTLDPTEKGSEAQRIPVKILSRNFSGLTLAWPEGVAVGDYQLVAVNGAVGYPGILPLRVDEPLDPSITRVSRTLIRNSNIPGVLEVRGTDFAPEIKMWLVYEPGLFGMGRKVPLQVEYLDDKTLKLAIPAQDHPLEIGTWHLELVNEPGRRTVLGPRLELAEDPVSRRLCLSAGWDVSVALSDWAVLYSVTPQGGDLGVSWFFTEHKRPIDGCVWDFGAHAEIDGVYFGKNWDSSKLDSNLLGVSAMAGPEVELSWLPVSFRLRLSGGAVFTSLEVTLDNVSHQKLLDQEIMPMSGLGLGVLYPVNDFFRLEMGFDWHRYYFVQPMDTMRVSLRTVLAFETR